MQIDLAKVKGNIQERDRLEREIENKRRRYKELVELFSSPEKQEELLKSIERNALALKEALAKLPTPPASMNARLKESEKATKRQIAELLIWLNGQYNVSNPLTNEQILGLADTITSQFGGLWLEQIADCFKQVILRPRNTVVYALDPPTVLSWLSEYRDKQQQANELDNFNKHLQTK